MAEKSFRAKGQKIEGLAVLANGDVIIVNDGVDDNSGDAQLMNLGRLLQ